MKRIIIFLLFTVFLFAQNIPQFNQFMNDETQTLSAQEINSLNKNLKEFQDSTSNQMVIYMTSGNNVESLEMFSISVAEKNKIGTKENSNGVLIVILKDKKEIRIEVGRGLEGALTDAMSGIIIRNEITPYFKNGDYFGGIQAGVKAIQQVVKGEYKAPKKAKKSSTMSAIGTIIVIIIFFIISAFMPKRRVIGGGYRTSSWGGGGFSGGGGDGGGFSGFSGGGGSFGGGGSSGSW